MSDREISDLNSSLHEAFEITQDGESNWIVRSPFLYEDGDNLPIFISYEDGRWYLTDRGMAISHLYFDEFEYSEARYRSIRQVVDYHYAEIADDHEITMPLDGMPTRFDVGDFIQLVAQIQVVAIVSHTEREQERYSKTIRSSIKDLVDIPGSRILVQHDWNSPSVSSRSKGRYLIDARLSSEGNGIGPINVFAASTDYRAALSTLTMQMVRPYDEDACFILVAHPGRVGDVAIARFEDATSGGDAVAKVTPSDLTPLYDKLHEKGIPISGYNARPHVDRSPPEFGL